MTARTSIITRKLFWRTECCTIQESAKKVFTDEASLEYIALGRAVQRAYFLTPNGNWFSAKEKIETESGITDVGDYRIQATKNHLHIQ